MNPTRHIFNDTVYFVYDHSDSGSSNPPLLMIHGHGGDHVGLGALARRLKATIIIPDLPGFGESKELTVSHSIENYVSHLTFLMDSLDYPQYFVLGHSLGSAIALTLAKSDTRVKRLVLLNPIPEFTVYIQRLIKTVNGVGSRMPQRVATALVNAQLYNLATFLLSSRKRTDRAYVMKYLKAQNTAKYSFKTWSESGESIFYFDHMKIAGFITIPALVMHGDKDSLTTLASIEHFVKALHAQLVRVPGAGHFLPLENDDEAAKAVQLFIDAYDPLRDSKTAA